MAEDLKFDVSATNRASGEFTEIAGRLVELARQLRSLDGRTARTKVELTGDAAANAAVVKLGGLLRALPRSTSTKVHVDVDKDTPSRLSAIGAAATRVGSVTAAAAAGVTKLRNAAKAIVDPASLPAVERFSDAIATRFHRAVDIAEVGVGKLRTGLRGLATGLAALGAANSATQVVGGLAVSVAQLSGSALLLPAALLAGAAAAVTWKTAFAGFGDAVKAKDAKAFAEATKDMAPAAVASATAVRGLKTEWLGVQKAVQTRAFAGVAAEVKALGATYLPVLRGGLSGIAGQLNGMVVAGSAAARSVAGVGAVRTILGNTDTALGRMRGTLASVVTGFLTLGGAGSAWLPRLAAGIDAAAAKFAAWSTRITTDGTFDRWVRAAGAAFSQFGQLLGNLAAIGGTVFTALDMGGVGLLATLAGLTGQLRTFLQSAQGSAALQALARTLQVTGAALSGVFAAALRVVGPLLVTLAPLVQAFATAVGAHLVTVIGVAAPLLQRLAQALAEHPELLLAIARAAAAVVLGFGPMVAIIGVAASVLKGLLLARLVGLAMAQLGLGGTLLATMLRGLVSPLSLVRDLLPLIARAVGGLGTSLLLATGPIGALIIAFAALYASSSQFRAAVADVAGTIGRLFVQALRDAGTIIEATITALQRIGAVFSPITDGVGQLGSAVASLFGPLGRLVSGALSGLFDLLGKLPGAALAAAAAFLAFGRVAPLLTAASAALAGMSSRLLAVQSASGVVTAGTTAAGVATGKFATLLGRLAGALPLIGVALIGLGFAYDAVTTSADEAATAVVRGEQSISAARAEAADSTEKQSRALGRFAEVQRNAKTPTDDLNESLKQQEAALSPLELAHSKVEQARKTYNDVLAEGGPSSAAQAAAAALAGAENDLEAAQRSAAEAGKDHNDKLRDQVSAAQSLLGSMLQLDDALARVAESEKGVTEAVKEHGAGSVEAADATRDYVQAADQAAQAAQRQVTANATARRSEDAAGEGARAYGATLLQLAANASGPAQQALLGYIAKLDNASLSALSAGAETSGFATQVLTLPDGRTVTIAVDPETGKIVSTQQLLDSMVTQKTIVIDGDTVPVDSALQRVLAAIGLGNGTVTISGETMPATQALQTLLQQVDLSQAQVTILGQSMPAQQVLDAYLAAVNSGSGTVTVNGQSAPAGAVLAALLSGIDSSVGTMTIDGNPAAAQAKLQATLAGVNSAHGTMTIDGNPTLANGKTTAAVRFADGSKGTITIDGNQTPANGKINATVTYANGRTGIIQVNANAAAANAAIDNAARNRTSTITVKYRTDAQQTSHIKQGGKTLAGGGVIGYAGGGIVPAPRSGVTPVHAAAGLVLPGYTPGRDSVPAVLSPGEAVLVPELVRMIGARHIIAANRAASGRQATTVGHVPVSIRAGTATAAARGGRVDLAAAIRASFAQLRTRPAAGGRIDMGPIVAELRAVRGELRGLTPRDSAVVAALDRLERTVTGSVAPAARAQDSRRAAGLGAWP